MRRLIAILAIFLMLAPLAGCGTSKSVEKEAVTGPRVAVPQSVKIRVVDVSNNTEELFDVDVIGLLWNSLDESLRKRNLLWKDDPSSTAPLHLEAHIVKYQKGSVFLRPVMPVWGKTLLAVRCDLKEGDRVITTVESKETITYGSGVFTINAWRKVFAAVAEDVVTQLSGKL
jgi:hypothetical protein